MKVKIVAVGKMKEDYYKQAVAEYVKRLSRFVNVEVVEVDECLFNGIPNQSEIDKILLVEGRSILQKAEGCVVVLDIAGKLFSSEQLAESVDKFAQTYSAITFVIGGSHGVSQEVKQKAHLLMSFGRITLPHRLCRVVLCEQVYRAFAINNNVPYHK